MRIYLIGAHSVGKSTLARYISEKYNLPLISEIARAILAEKEINLESLRANLDLTNDYQRQIFFRQIERESQQNDFVSDRSFDCLAYAAQHSTILPDLIYSKELQEYLKILKDKNSFIFFIRPSKATLKDDGVRELINWDQIIAIDAMIKMLCKIWNLRYFQIDSSNMQERIHFADCILSLAN